jgi:SSS family solute:Na+ symporter
MSSIDWIVLVLTLSVIIVYGLYRSRTTKDLDGYFRSNQSMPWFLVLLSIMGTQASAITFLSAPGQAYTDGMRFVQYYFGLPLAMIVICIAFVPVFKKLNVYTAYEFLENRFDLRTRTLTSILFLISRGLSTGISVFAPSIILSSLFGWNIYFTNVVMGGMLIIYTVSGGARAVAYTQQLQFIIIFIGMFLAGYLVIHMLPDSVGFVDALHVSGKLGKLNVITSGMKDGSFDWSDKYNIWSGLIGGFFLALSYFGTDQSQVGRYLTAKSLKESRVGLLMNGLVKIPMQFLILLIGVLVFCFYSFFQAPVFFNSVELAKLEKSTVYSDSLQTLKQDFNQLNLQKQKVVAQYVQLNNGDENTSEMDAQILEMRRLDDASNKLRKKVKVWIDSPTIKGDSNDTNYIFLRFVIDFLPKGLVGLLIAIIFLAAWGSIAAALNSLASSSIIDLHKRHSSVQLTKDQEYRLSRWYTFGWGVFCIGVACFAYNLGNSLIEVVNILGSIFYGPILGIFLCAFWMKSCSAKAVFWSALLSQTVVIILFKTTSISFLWYNVIGCLILMLAAWILSHSIFKKNSVTCNQ